MIAIFPQTTVKNAHAIRKKQQLGIERLTLNDRYCNVVSSSRPIRIPEHRKTNMLKRLYPRQEKKVQSKKELLNSLKDELNSTTFDFMRFNNVEKEVKKAA